MTCKDWKVCRIEEVADVKGGKRVPKGTKEFIGTNKHPYIRAQDLKNKRMLELSQSLIHISDETFEKISRYTVETNDVIMSNVGNGLGMTSIVGKTLNMANLTENCVKFINLSGITYKFLYYYLSSVIGQNEIKKYTVGAAQPKLPIKGIKDFKISLPLLNEQIAVVNILSSLDDKIEINNTIIRNLKETSQLLYKRWFIDFEFPNKDGEPFKSSGGEMIVTELGPIPKGWSVTELSEVLSTNRRGIAPKYTTDIGKGIPVINQRCIRNHTIIEEAIQYHDNTQKLAKNYHYHKPWDILINSMGVGTLGRVSISSKSNGKLVHSCITILRPNTKIKKEVFSQSMLYLEPVFTAMGEGSTGQTSIKNTILEKIKIVLASSSIQEIASPLFEVIQEKIDSNYKENSVLTELRDKLLPKLISGEIRVPIKG